MARTHRALLAAAWAVLAGGCGYRFTAGGAPLPEDIRSVCVDVFENRTAEPGLELTFTSALRERAIRAGTLAGGCQGRIAGEVLNVWGGPWVSTSAGALASYRIFATVHLRLSRGGRAVAEAEVTGAEDYLPGPEAGGDILHVEASRQAALRRLAQSLMRDGYERLATAW